MKLQIISKKNKDIRHAKSKSTCSFYRKTDQCLHKFKKAHEYKRAINAAKLERIFAKPFVAALRHEDSVTCMAKNVIHPNLLLTGSADGVIRYWDLTAMKCLTKLIGHKKSIRGISLGHNGESCVSCSDDCSVKLWDIRSDLSESEPLSPNLKPRLEFFGEHPYNQIDHSLSEPIFLTGGETVTLWEYCRQKPYSNFAWGADSVNSVRFNPVEKAIFAASGSDRNIVLYDSRLSKPVHTLSMQTRTTAISWNPIAAFNFTASNEDSNLYTYDMRRMKTALFVHTDFVSSVLDVDYSPTGHEFVAGSYDRSIRIFGRNSSHSREIYHTKRMNRVLTVKFSSDAEYVFSGSDDMAVRIWKAVASKQQTPLLQSEKRNQDYKCAIVKRYQKLPEVDRILNKRIVPKSIFKTNKLKREMEKAERRKRKNVSKRNNSC